jgi:predicted membrane protein
MYKLIIKLVSLAAAVIEYILSSVLGILLIIPTTILLTILIGIILVMFILWLPIALTYSLFKAIMTGKHCHGVDISIRKENDDAKDG